MSVRLPEFITFTGVDDHTNIADLQTLSRAYPIEWGVLFSPKRQGVDPRYPSGAKLSVLLWSDLMLSAHLCGQYAEMIMAGSSLATTIPVDLGYFHRVQINHASLDSRAIVRFRNGWGRMRCIAQTRAEEFPNDTSVDWLCDASGGRGLARTSWPKHPGHRLVGYAGGLNPVNVVEALHVMAADGPYWIDMETGVRTDDRFDIAKCRAVCEAVYGSRD